MLGPHVSNKVDPAVVGAANLKRCFSNAFSSPPPRSNEDSPSNNNTVARDIKSRVPPSELSTIHEDSREEELRMSNLSAEELNLSRQEEIERGLRARVENQEAAIKAQRAQLARLEKTKADILAAQEAEVEHVNLLEAKRVSLEQRRDFIVNINDASPELRQTQRPITKKPPQPAPRHTIPDSPPSQVDGMQDPSIVALQRSPEAQRASGQHVVGNQPVVEIHSSAAARNKRSYESGYSSSNSPTWSGNLKEAFLPSKGRKGTPYPDPQPRSKPPGNNNPFRSQPLGLDETPKVRDPDYFKDLAPAGATPRAPENSNNSLADMMVSPVFRAGIDELVRAHQVQTTDI